MNIIEIANIHKSHSSTTFCKSRNVNTYMFHNANLSATIEGLDVELETGNCGLYNNDYDTPNGAFSFSDSTDELLKFVDRYSNFDEADILEHLDDHDIEVTDYPEIFGEPNDLGDIVFTLACLKELILDLDNIAEMYIQELDSKVEASAKVTITIKDNEIFEAQVDFDLEDCDFGAESITIDADSITEVFEKIEKETGLCLSPEL